jgi:hypothetical protein
MFSLRDDVFLSIETKTPRKELSPRAESKVPLRDYAA